jgi:hypothetical protein
VGFGLEQGQGLDFDSELPLDLETERSYEGKNEAIDSAKEHTQATVEQTKAIAEHTTHAS